jgi:hypothetical protein
MAEGIDDNNEATAAETSGETVAALPRQADVEYDIEDTKFELKKLLLVKLVDTTDRHVFYQTSMRVVTILKKHPLLASEPTEGDLPLFHVLNAPLYHPNAIMALCDAHPEVLKVKSKRNGDLPVHRYCKGMPLLVVLELMINLYPDAIAIRNNDGELPIHCLLRTGHTRVGLENIKFMLEKDPTSVMAKAAIFPGPDTEWKFDLLQMALIRGCDRNRKLKSKAIFSILVST